MTKITLEYYGVEGTGRTVTEAKKDAGAKIEKSLTGDYNPEMLTYRGVAILLYRDPQGWHSHIVVDENGPHEGRVYGWYGGDMSYAEVKRSALAHLAQITWKTDDETNPPAFLKDRASIADFRTWAEFQLRYRDAKLLGMNDNDAHSYAGRNPARPELWRESVAV